MYQHSVPAEPESALLASPDVAPGARADAAVASAPVEPVATQTPEPAGAADVKEASHPFREELARAMQAAAQRERLRIEGRIDDDANSHVAKVRVRASVEADELKRLAEDDVSRIRTWCKVEVERIRAEADIQVGERRDRLEEHLGQHASIIDGEIDRVSEAVEGYRHELEVFFVGLSAVKDPSEIARLADAVPGPPDFELIRAIARADAVGRLSDLEAASASEMTTSADSATDDDANLSDEGEPAEATAEPELVAVMDPAFARAAQMPAVEATSGAQAVPVAQTISEAVPVVEAVPATEAEPAPSVAPVAVMEPALAPTHEASQVVAAMPAEIESVAEATPAVAVEAVATAPIGTAAEPELVGVMDPELAQKAEAEAIADAAAEAAAETSDPELVAAGATSEPNAATRFLRSLTAWGSSDHGNNGHK